MLPRRTQVAVLVDETAGRPTIDVDYQVRDFLRWFSLTSPSDAPRVPPVAVAGPATEVLVRRSALRKH